MATLNQALEYLQNNIVGCDDDGEDFLAHFEMMVRERGTGLYIVEFSRGDLDCGWMSEANYIDDIFAQDPDRYQEFTTPEEYENGIICDEENVIFDIISIP